MLATPEERIVVEARRHGIVLVAGWPFSPAGAALLVAAALAAVTAVWRWDRTQVVLTTEKLFVVHGVVRRRAAAVRLERVGTVELEQTLLGRLLRYGTVVAGDLEISYVAEPREVYGLVERLSH